MNVKSENRSVPELQWRRMAKLVVVAATLTFKSSIVFSFSSLSHLKDKLAYADNLAGLKELGVNLNPTALQVVMAVDANMLQPPSPVSVKKFYGRCLD